MTQPQLLEISDPGFYVIVEGVLLEICDMDTDQDDANKLLALKIHLDDFTSGMEIDGNTVSVGSQEYLVLTGSEADDAWDESLQQYLDDCVLPELPQNLRHYFDEDAWKRDAKTDGRGHSLSPYDGNEDEVRLDDIGETFYIYRTN